MKTGRNLKNLTKKLNFFLFIDFGLFVAQTEKIEDKLKKKNDDLDKGRWY